MIMRDSRSAKILIGTELLGKVSQLSVRLLIDYLMNHKVSSFPRCCNLPDINFMISILDKIRILWMRLILLPVFFQLLKVFPKQKCISLRAY